MVKEWLRPVMPDASTDDQPLLFTPGTQLGVGALVFFAPRSGTALAAGNRLLVAVGAGLDEAHGAMWMVSWQAATLELTKGRLVERNLADRRRPRTPCGS